MSNFTQAAEELRNYAKRVQGILDVIPALEKLGSLDNAIIEKTNLVEKLSKELDAWKEHLSTTKEAVRLESEKLYALEEDSKTLGNRIITSAKEAAAREIASAKAEIETLWKSIQLDREAKENEIRDLQDNKKFLEQQIAEGNFVLAELKKELAAIRERLA